MSSDGFYPPRLWGVDKLYWTHVQLNIVDVLELPEYPGQSGSGCYSLGNHPICRVEVMGDIVRLHGKSRNVVFDVDDGTGVISCCLWRPGKDSDDGVPNLELGQLVTVQGRVTLYLGARQITASAICKALSIAFWSGPVLLSTVKSLKKMCMLSADVGLNLHISRQIFTANHLLYLRICPKMLDGIQM
jgi:hypothetical protein